MQEIQFEATVKNGYIKIPERYSSLNNKKVVVDILIKILLLKRKKIG